MFGGYQACVADPFPAIACGRIFPEYSSWTRAMSVDFQRGGVSDLTFKFDFSSQQEMEIRRDLEEKGRSTPTFECGFYDKENNLITKVTNVVAIRSRGYIKATTPPADNEFASTTLQDIEAQLRERFLSAMHIKVAPENLDRRTLLARFKDRGLPTSEPVDRDAFEGYLRFMGIHKKLNESQRDELFSLLDRDQDGRIDLEDFLLWWKAGGLERRRGSKEKAQK